MLALLLFNNSNTELFIFHSMDVEMCEWNFISKNFQTQSKQILERKWSDIGTKREMKDKQKSEMSELCCGLGKTKYGNSCISIRLQKYVFERHRKCLLKDHMYYMWICLPLLQIICYFMPFSTTNSQLMQERSSRTNVVPLKWETNLFPKYTTVLLRTLL